MKSGDNVFENMPTYLIEQNEEGLIGDSNDQIKSEEIRWVSFLNYLMVIWHAFLDMPWSWKHVGNFRCSFSSLHVVRVLASETFVAAHESQLKNDFLKWRQMRFSITHKMHVALVHSIKILKLRNNMAHIEESWLERAHQFQSRDRD